MKNTINVHSHNEWDQLKAIVVGRAEDHKWPINDSFFNKNIASSTFPGQFNHDIPQWLIREAEEDLNQLCELLDKQNVQVLRPAQDSYNARDILMVIGETLFVSPTPFDYRKNEYEKYAHIVDIQKAKILEKKTEVYFDAANIARFNDKLLYLVSSTGTTQGADYLQNTLGDKYEVIKWEGVYAHAHIDSTLLPLNDHTVLCNATRINEQTVPDFLKNWKKIWVKDITAREFYKFPYASKWIGCNVLSINPETVVVDSIQVELKKQLEENGFKVLSTPMRHSRTLGGGLHCTTLDLIRQS